MSAPSRGSASLFDVVNDGIHRVAAGELDSSETVNRNSGGMLCYFALGGHMIEGEYRLEDDALHQEMLDTSFWLYVRDGAVFLQLLISEQFSLPHADGSQEVSEYLERLDTVFDQYFDSCGGEGADCSVIAETFERLAAKAKLAIAKANDATNQSK